MAAKFKLKPGQKLCSNCYSLCGEQHQQTSLEQLQQTSLEQHHETSEASSDSEFHSPEFNRTLLNQVAQSMDCTPVKSNVSRRDALSYGKRKAKEIQSQVKTKLARTFDFSLGKFDSQEEEEETKDSCKDLDRLMVLLGKKIVTSTRQEKIKLLTLVPESWTRQRAVQVFGVTDHMVRRSRQLKREKGILADPDPKRGGRQLSEDVKERIMKFYQSEEYSRTCPGKKDFVTMKEDGEKVHKQKQLLLVNLKELYVEYKSKYPTDKVGFSKFCDSRLKWCIPVTASGMHSVCVCEQHQNAKLITAVIPDSHDYKDLLEKIVCSVNDRKCMLHLCESCSGKLGLEQYLSDLFSLHDFDSDDMMTYKQWAHTDRTAIFCITASVQEFIQTACNSFESLRQHHFIAKAQSSYLSTLKGGGGPFFFVGMLKTFFCFIVFLYMSAGCVSTIRT